MLQFWFEELTPEDLFRKDPSLDRRIAERLGSTLAAFMVDTTTRSAAPARATAASILAWLGVVPVSKTSTVCPR